MNSSNSTIARLRELAEANKQQAQEIELDRLRTEQGLWKAQYAAACKDKEILNALVTRYEDELKTLLEFVMSSGVELTLPVANVIAVHEELRLVPNRQASIDVTWNVRM